MDAPIAVEKGAVAVPLGARVFRPAAAGGGFKSPPAKPATTSLPACAAPRLRPAGGSEDPRTDPPTQRNTLVWTIAVLLGLTACTAPPDTAPPAVETTALWLFDEPAGLYPSHTLDDMSDNDMVLTLGLGAQVVPGRYGNALLLAPLDPPLDVPPAEEKPGEFGLARLPIPEGRTVEPLSWFTAHYAALMTSGENHLRKQVGFKNPTTSALNLGDFDWTVEFWHSPGGPPADAPGDAGGSGPGRALDGSPGGAPGSAASSARSPASAEAAPSQSGDPSAAAEAVVFEIGTGPRGEKDIVTQLKWSADRSRFVLVNQPSGVVVEIPSIAAAAPADGPPADAGSSTGAASADVVSAAAGSLGAADAADWRHYAFTYDSATDQLSHYVDGTLQPQPQPPTAALEALPAGDEAYFVLASDGLFSRPLTGLLDEFRVSRGLVYTADFAPDAGGGAGAPSFDPPATFATTPAPLELTKGPPLLFVDASTTSTVSASSSTATASTVSASASPSSTAAASTAAASTAAASTAAASEPLNLGTRKHVFIDGAILASSGDTEFVVNPPKRAERVIDNIRGTFRKHLTVIEGDDGVIRIYNSVEDDHLAVYTSTDGVHFDRPDQGRGEINGHRNIVIPDMVGGLGSPFRDPHGPPEERWKYLTDYQRRGIYLYTSPDGYDWTRRRNIILPFRSGTQSSTFYDDQRQVYVAFHRSGIFHTPGGATQRSSVVTEHEDLRATQPFAPLTQQEYLDLRAEYPLRDPLPWWVDNGPLTPGGFGMEYPHLFDPTSEDPAGVDFYLTKAIKYPYAPDTYLAFPVGYFHYYGDGPEARTVLGLEERGLGSGPLESQVAVSRNGLDWKRYPEPAYVGIGRHEGRDVVTAYIAQGMVRRGEELWQYYFGETHYHSPHTEDPDGRGVYRLVQRLDGFISLDSPYGREATAITRPLVFAGNRLQLNVDTDAVGYVQVGFLDERGREIDGYTVDDCVYINGDFIAKEVDWLRTGADLSPLVGKTVQVVLRMRGAKLYAMQFAEGG